MRWSESDTIKFVELYRNNECLWDVNSANYRNKPLRQAAYEALARDMGLEDFGVFDVKQKIKNLRNTYNQEVIKIEKSRKPGVRADEIYTPSLKWFFIMDSLVRHIKEEKSMRINREFPVCVGDQEETTDDEVNARLNTQECYGDQGVEEEVAEEARRPPQAARLVFSYPGSSVYRKRCQEITAVQGFRHVSKIRRQSFAEEDDFDAFGRYMTLSLKKLPLHLALQAQHDIQSTLTRYRMMDANPSASDTGSITSVFSLAPESTATNSNN